MDHPLGRVVLGDDRRDAVVGRHHRRPGEQLQVRRGVDQHDVEVVADLRDELPEGVLQEPMTGRIGVIKTGQRLGRRDGEQTGNIRGVDDPFGRRIHPVVEQRDHRPGRVEFLDRAAPEEALREARLGVAVDDEHPLFAAGHFAGGMEDQTRLADAPFAIARDDDFEGVGHPMHLVFLANASVSPQTNDGSNC